jgi:N-terminal acetyltransferase B complex catalytic subunit
LFFHIYYYLVIGKAEGSGPEWHGHVTAVTVAPQYRRIGYATKLMAVLENVSEDSYVLNYYFSFFVIYVFLISSTIYI